MSVLMALITSMVGIGLGCCVRYVWETSNDILVNTLFTAFTILAFAICSMIEEERY